MKNKIAQVSNIKMLWHAFETLRARAAGVPGICLICGMAGFGKSVSVTWLAVQPMVNAVFVRAQATWTARAMLEKIMLELDAEPLTRNSAMVDYIVRELTRTERPLIVDECDYLVEHGGRRLDQMIDTLRDIHDLSSVPLILVGMKDFQRRVTRKEQLARRVVQWVEFQPTDLKDARIVADEICEVQVADDLLASLHKNAAGSIGRIVVGLAKIENFARQRGKPSVALADWGDRPFSISEAPRPAQTARLR